MPPLPLPDIPLMTGWAGFIGSLYFYLDYKKKVGAIAEPYLDVKNSKGQKILMILDDGTNNYRAISAKKEALGYTTLTHGHFEHDEEAIKHFYGVSMGLAHVDLEVMIPPATAVWLRAHGQEVTMENIDKLPDAFQYLFCPAVAKTTNGEGKETTVPCGWVGPLVSLENHNLPMNKKKMWGKIKKTTEEELDELLKRFENEKNPRKKEELDKLVSLKKKELPEEPHCPKCNSVALEVKTDRTLSVIPNQTLYNLTNVRRWVDRVVSPVNIDIAIEETKMNTKRKMKDTLMNLLPWIVVCGTFLVMAAIAYVIIKGGTGQGIGNIVQGATKGIGMG